MPYAELARRVGGPPVARTVETRDGPLKIEVTFERVVASRSGVRVTATAYGPSWWRLERLEGATTVLWPNGNDDF
jgi:hypothetical protein